MLHRRAAIRGAPRRPRRPGVARRGLAALSAALALLPAAQAADVFTPDFRVHPDDINVLMAVDARRSGDLAPFQPGGHGKFFLQAWSRADQSAAWTVTVPAADDYAVRVLVSEQQNRPLRAEVSSGPVRVAGRIPPSPWPWNRVDLEGTLRLAAGAQEIALRLAPAEGAGPFLARVMSVELVRPAVRDRLHAAALRARADTRWFRAARYGFMVHWTSQSMPRRGDAKPYEQAVRDFDVGALADQVKDGGAGFLVFTASHAFQYFPAPLQSLDAILPGRTSRRDLVADLADALGKRGIRLFLYYHLGAVPDHAWLQACGFWETDTSRLFGNWEKIIREAGERYRDKLAGWWFDDGTTSYYYRRAPWERLLAAARAGNPARLVAFNAWELPPATEFQDYHCGEGDGDATGRGMLAAGGDGRYAGGPYRGLQAAATLVTEQDWVHGGKDLEIGRPPWSAPQLADLLKRFAERRNVPIFNLEIYQEGFVSPQTIDLFKQARAQAGWTSD